MEGKNILAGEEAAIVYAAHETPIFSVLLCAGNEYICIIRASEAVRVG